MTDYSSILIAGLAIVSLFGVLNLIAAWWLVVFVMDKGNERTWKIVRAIRLATGRLDRSTRNEEYQGPEHSDAGGISQFTLIGSSLNSTSGLNSSHGTEESEMFCTSFTPQELKEMEEISIPLNPGSTLTVKKAMFRFGAQ